jgi:hypothetical protein
VWRGKPKKQREEDEEAREEEEERRIRRRIREVLLERGIAGRIT